MVFCVIFFMLYPKANASINPISLSLLTPVALESARFPYTKKISLSGRHRSSYIIRSFVDLFRFPFGIFQSTLGSPWGQFRPGMMNIVLGITAPLRLTNGVFQNVGLFLF